MSTSVLDRYRGAMLGLACGDAVGTTVEFKPRGSFPAVTDMVGGGPFELAAGQWTDDTSMALCLADSLLAMQGFDPHDQMKRYVRWWREGYRSSTGRCFDIGTTTRQALAAFERTGEPYAGSTDRRAAGNGSLMRLAPVVLWAHPDPVTLERLAADSSRTTHGAAEAIECCIVFARLLSAALSGVSPAGLSTTSTHGLVEPLVKNIAAGSYSAKTEREISGSGYCVQSLEAALWCFHSTTSFEAAVLKAANLGDDADTTAAIVGQLAGAVYGMTGIPPKWLERLHDADDIVHLSDALHDRKNS